MIVYTIIMFMAAVVFGVIAVLVCKGKTNLVHDYHQTKVTDKVGYGKSFGKALGILAGTMALSGAVALFGETAIWDSVALLAVGLFVGITAIIRVQKKYNGGVF